MSMLMGTCSDWVLPDTTIDVLVVGVPAPFDVEKPSTGLVSLTQYWVPDSKSQPRQPPHSEAPSVHWQLPELQVSLDAHALVQEPQWVPSLPLTLMQPLLPQSVVPAGQLHVPFEQVLPPVQSELPARH